MLKIFIINASDKVIKIFHTITSDIDILAKLHNYTKIVFSIHYTA